MALQTLDIQKQIEAMERISKEICKDKQTALNYLIEHGFLTPEGKIADKYK